MPISLQSNTSLMLQNIIVIVVSTAQHIIIYILNAFATHCFASTPLIIVNILVHMTLPYKRLQAMFEKR